MLRGPRRARGCAAILLVLSAATSVVPPEANGAAGQRPPDLAQIDWLAPCPERFPDRSLCGKYAVWEDRDAARGRRIELSVLIIPARGPERSADPLLYLAGGPGGASGRLAFISHLEPWASINRSRDLLFIDRRGTGLSHPLECDLYGADAQGHLGDFLPLDAVASCRRKLEEIADLTLYTSPLAMDDIEEVRRALGYGRLNLYAVSYGTREAAVFVHRHPQSVRSLALMGVADPRLHMPEPYPRDTESALDAVIEACRADGACDAAYPRLRQKIDAIAERLARAPARAEVRLSELRGFDGEGTAVVEYGRSVFAEMIRYLLYATNHSRALPWLVQRAYEGDFRPLAEWSINRRRALAGGEGVFLSVTCSQDLPLVDAQRVRELAAGTLLGTYRYEQQIRACSLWPAAPVPEEVTLPLSTDVPVLLLSGAYDPATPASRAEQFLEELPNGLHLVVPGAGHGLGGVSGVECVNEAMVAFLDNGTEAVDATCLASMRRMPFQFPDAISDEQGERASDLPLALPAACETELALSAAPAGLRPGASVYVLAASGFELVKEGTNGFTCIVNRDHPYALKPTCFDAEGSATIVPKILRYGELLSQGVQPEEIQAEVEARFQDGTFAAPRRPGIAYMLSDYNRPYDPASDTLGWFPPHVMFYAPHLTAESIGFSADAWRSNRRLPFIGYQGPHGYMIVIVEDAADPQRTRLSSCPDWLRGDRPWSRESR